MMEKMEQLIASLEPEIEKKCRQLQKKKREKVAQRLFLALIALALILPPVLVFAGVAMAVIWAPIGFIAAGFFVLSPLLISKGVSLGE